MVDSPRKRQRSESPKKSPKKPVEASLQDQKEFVEEQEIEDKMDLTPAEAEESYESDGSLDENGELKVDKFGHLTQGKNLEFYQPQVEFILCLFLRCLAFKTDFLCEQWQEFKDSTISSFLGYFKGFKY